jgi:hypothetical protein
LQRAACTGSIFCDRGSAFCDRDATSANVQKKLMMTINTLQQFERIDLYHTFASVNSTRAVAGLLYESLGHVRRLEEGIDLTLKPMVRKKE